MTADQSHEPTQGVDSLAYQDSILPDVSRTFALTIPQLPSGLNRAIANAYLLCRIADTIEDEPALEMEEKTRFHRRFVEVLDDTGAAAEFARELGPRLTGSTTAAERDLVAHTDRVVDVTRSLPRQQQRVIRRCVEIMSEGMPEFERRASRAGLPDVPALDRYCYYVAGVVGQMLAELFCDHSPEMAKHRQRLQSLAVSFGLGLQMTNILKDIWDDYERGVCWLPGSVFGCRTLDLRQLRDSDDPQAFIDGINELLGLAHGHLRNALEFTLLIPPEEKGIRRFCLWAIGLALLTLRRIYANPRFIQGDQVKVSRGWVKAVILTTNLGVSSDRLLRLLFRLAAGPLPRRDPVLDDPPDSVVAMAAR